MAFSATYNTTNPGSATGNREHLLDVVTELAPEENPMLALASKIKADATNVEFNVDVLADPDDTPIGEGVDVDNFTDQFAGKAKLGARCQKFRKTFRVSDRQQAVSSTGPADIANAESKALRDLKRSIEKRICGTADSAIANGAGIDDAMRGFGKWISASPGSDVPSNFVTPTGSLHTSGALSEAAFNNLITSIYRESGEMQKLTLVADTALRRVISDYQRAEGSTTATAYNVNENAVNKTITLNVGLYDSNHGVVSVVDMNPKCAPDTTNMDTGYLVNPEYWQVAELISMGSTRLENQGGGERGYVDCTLTAYPTTPLAHGAITAVS